MTTKDEWDRLRERKDNLTLSEWRAQQWSDISAKKPPQYHPAIRGSINRLPGQTYPLVRWTGEETK